MRWNCMLNMTFILRRRARVPIARRRKTKVAFLFLTGQRWVVTSEPCHFDVLCYYAYVDYKFLLG